MGLLLSILGIVIPASGANAMDTNQVVNTQLEVDVAVSQSPNVETHSNKPHDGLLGDFGFGRSFSQVKGPADRSPDTRPWDDVEEDIVVATSGYHNTSSAGRVGRGDCENVDGCTGATSGPMELAAGQERSTQGHIGQAAGAGHSEDVGVNHPPVLIPSNVSQAQGPPWGFTLISSGSLSPIEKPRYHVEGVSATTGAQRAAKSLGSLQNVERSEVSQRNAEYSISEQQARVGVSQTSVGRGGTNARTRAARQAQTERTSFQQTETEFRVADGHGPTGVILQGSRTDCDRYIRVDRNIVVRCPDLTACDDATAGRWYKLQCELASVEADLRSISDRSSSCDPLADTFQYQSSHNDRLVSPPASASSSAAVTTSPRPSIVTDVPKRHKRDSQLPGYKDWSTSSSDSDDAPSRPRSQSLEHGKTRQSDNDRGSPVRQVQTPDARVDACTSPMSNTSGQPRYFTVNKCHRGVRSEHGFPPSPVPISHRPTPPQAVLLEPADRFRPYQHVTETRPAIQPQDANSCAVALANGLNGDYGTTGDNKEYLQRHLVGNQTAFNNGPATAPTSNQGRDGEKLSRGLQTSERLTGVNGSLTPSQSSRDDRGSRSSGNRNGVSDRNSDDGSHLPRRPK